MPSHFYRITCTLKDGDVRVGTIKHPSDNLKNVYLIYWRQAQDRFGEDVEFDLVKVCEEYDKEAKKLMRGTITHELEQHDPKEEWYLNQERPLDTPPSKTRKEVYRDQARKKDEDFLDRKRREGK